MPLFGSKEEEKKIYHIDSLNEHMRNVIKTVMDVNMNDLAYYYGLKYLSPVIGEPIFIPYGRLDGKFNDFEKAFEKLYQEIEKIKDKGLKQYLEWYPGSKFLDHYRIVFYSEVQEGITYGIGAEPLAFIPSNSFGLPNIEGEAVVIGMQLLNLAVLKKLNLKFYDLVKDKRDEVIEAYNWLYSEFHAKYDTKDRKFLTDIASYYMRRFFQQVYDVAKDYTTDKLEGKIAIIPLVESKAKKDGKIIDVWREDLRDLLEQARYYLVEAIPAIYNQERMSKILKQVGSNFEEIILTSQKKPKIPEELKDLKVKTQGDKFVVLTK
ncbi:hypothetical protein SUSAZ_01860 [Sulfolobus acidocaldarius SUSAZ]|nr:hypothetical protein SUSAZ_01860 [Sulfolobus acidocaldarius SUSAZ]